MRKIALFILALLVSTPVFAAELPVKRMSVEKRTERFFVHSIQIPVKGTDTTIGKNGVLMSADAHGLLNLVMTSTIGQMSYPARLQVGFNDGGSATTTQLSCDLVTITGKNQFGETTSENLTTVNETVQHTVNVYESVSRIVASGCNGGGGAGGDSSDLVFVGMSSKGIGLPVKITDVAAVLSMCLVDASDSSARLCMKGAASDAATTFDNSGSGNRLSTLRNYVDVSGTFAGVTVAAGDGLIIRLRAPAGL